MHGESGIFYCYFNDGCHERFSEAYRIIHEDQNNYKRYLNGLPNWNYAVFWVDLFSS